MNIYTFSPGKSITRTEPVVILQKSYYDSNLGVHRDRDPEQSFQFIGMECTLLGIANGSINIRTNGLIYVLPLHPDYPAQWSEGWEEYVSVELPVQVPNKKRRDVDWLRAFVCSLISFLVYTISQGYDDNLFKTLGSAIPALLTVMCLSNWWFSDKKA